MHGLSAFTLAVLTTSYQTTRLYKSIFVLLRSWDIVYEEDRKPG